MDPLLDRRPAGSAGSWPQSGGEWEMETVIGIHTYRLPLLLLPLPGRTHLLGTLDGLRECLRMIKARLLLELAHLGMFYKVYTIRFDLRSYFSAKGSPCGS